MGLWDNTSALKAGGVNVLVQISAQAGGALAFVETLEGYLDTFHQADKGSPWLNDLETGAASFAS